MLKKFCRITLALILALAVCVPLIAEVDAAKSAPKIGSIAAMFDTTFLTKEQGQKYLLDEYKKLTGIELKVLQPVHNQYYEKLMVAFASNDIPDIVELDAEHYLQFAAEGALRPIDDLVAKSKLGHKVEKIYLDAVRLRDGKMYAFPLNRGGGTVTYIRKDWLDNLGLKVPKTYEELYKVMQAFTFNDPDKNGKNDTVGCTLPGIGDEMYMRDFCLDATPAFTQKDGKWIDGFSQPNFKPALERLRQAYQDKVLDQETFTNQTSTAREKFYLGKVGIFNYWSGTWGKVIDDNVKSNCGPKAETLALPAIKGSFYYNRVPAMLAITKGCKNPEGVFKNLLEVMYDGGKGQLLFTHGVEGVHYKMEGETLVKLPSPANKNQLFGKAFIHPEFALTQWKDPYPLPEKLVASRKANTQTMRQIKLLPPSETYIKYGPDLAVLKAEMIAKAMIGQLAVDEALKQYKEKSAALNLEKMLAEFNK